MNTYGNFSSRSPAVQRDPALLPSTTVSFKDAGWPELGRSLAYVVMNHGLAVPLRLTAKQLEVLQQEVVTPTGKFPSPAKEQQVYSAEWTIFMTRLLEMPVWNHVPHTMGGLIKLVVGYHWQGGWLQYRPKAEDPVQGVAEDWSVNQWMRS